MAALTKTVADTITLNDFAIVTENSVYIIISYPNNGWIVVIHILRDQ